MADNRKTIQFNSDIFSTAGRGGTRKKKPTIDNDGIKIKSPSAQKRDDTLRKSSILRMIRKHQEDEYNKRLQPGDKINNVYSSNNNNNNIHDLAAMNDFKQAETYLSHLVDKTEQNKRIKNQTIRQYPSQSNSSLLFHPQVNPLNEAVSLSLPDSLSAPIKINSPNPLILPMPKYGILKNGTLPTVRSSLNRTYRNYPTYNVQSNASAIAPSSSMNFNHLTEMPIEAMTPIRGIDEIKLDESLKKMSEIKQTMSKLELMQKHQHNMKSNKQRRIIRRTYKVGKSKVLPNISVLVSNKTIRNNISTKTQLLKQTPTEEIKKYLIKRGLIKVGSTAPNDVLRKMYESTMLICGEIQNHNSDNLLHNFLHGQ